jgi:hypothetical protein
MKEFGEDATSGCQAEVGDFRNPLDACFDDINRGSARSIDGEAFFEDLRQLE